MFIEEMLLLKIGKWMSYTQIQGEKLFLNEKCRELARIKVMQYKTPRSNGNTFADEQDQYSKLKLSCLLITWKKLILLECFQYDHWKLQHHTTKVKYLQEKCYRNIRNIEGGKANKIHLHPSINNENEIRWDRHCTKYIK